MITTLLLRMLDRKKRQSMKSFTEENKTDRIGFRNVFYLFFF